MYDFNKFKKHVFPDGIYQFEIEYINVNAISKAGKPCLELKFLIKKDGKESVLKQTISWEITKLIKNFCGSIGRPDCYEKGQLRNEDGLGAKGFFELKTEVFNGENSNKVVDYIIEENNIEQSTNDFKKAYDTKLDDDIGF